MTLASFFAALTAICAWIAIPLPGISFTMQTFAVLLTLGALLYSVIQNRNLDAKLFA
mgnify:CR=1 FL=1